MLEVFIAIIAILLAFVPVIIGFVRSHNKTPLINILIMIGGFTMSLLAKTNMYVAIGQFIILWVAALLWSLSKDVQTKYH